MDTEGYKQLLDKIFLISRIIKVEVGVTTLTDPLIILDIVKTESKIVSLYIERNKKSHVWSSKHQTPTTVL